MHPYPSRLAAWVGATSMVALVLGCAPGRAEEVEPDAQGRNTAVRAETPTPRLPSEFERGLRAEFEGSFALNAPASTGVKEWTITAAPAEVEIFDGRKLDVWCYNGRVPGPILRIRFGETVRVHFKNELPMPSTIHWHGVRVPNAMDGVPEITQPPVLPGETFVYEFTPKDSGTYWFHPHVRSAEQVERGLYGLLIVEDAEPLPYTRDVVWVLDDWRLTPDGSQIDPNFITRSDLAHDGRWGNVIAVNGRLGHELVVKAGERIRLRMLNSANGRVFVPDVWRLDAKVIAVDGKYVARPFRPKRFEMAPGNRLDLDITFKREDAGRTIAIDDAFGIRPNRLATIRVLDDVVETPRFPAPAAPKVPKWSGAETLAPHLEYVLNARRGGQYGVEWTLNDVAYSPHNRRDVLYFDEWTKIRFTNESARLHPMHIHGQFFKLLSRNGRPVDEGFWRDTVLTHSKETVEIGLVPWDEGAWMLHCHILEHAAAGMMTVVDVRRRTEE